MADALGWHEEVRYRVPSRQHINIKEARAYRTFVRRAARDAARHHSRRLSLLDSSVTRGAAAKGRSSSRRLNAVLRPVVPEQLAANIQTGTLPVPTEFNPADDPTRGRRTRSKGRKPMPDWYTGIAAGEYGAWDEMYAASLRKVPACLFDVGSRYLNYSSSSSAGACDDW